MRNHQNSGRQQRSAARFLLGFGLLLGLGLPVLTSRATDAATQTAIPKPGSFGLSAFYSQDVKREVFEHDNLGDREDATLRGRFIQAAYGICPGVDVSLRVGQMMWDPHSPNGGEYDYGPAWGFGVRSRFYGLPDRGIAFGTAFQYNHASPADRKRPGLDTFEGEIEEWQISADASYRWDRALLFAGARFSQVKLVYQHDGAYGTREGGFEETDQVGLFFGAELTVWENISITGEIRAVDVNGASAGICYTF